MKKQESEILSRFGKDPGFKVPDNYFADFAGKMKESLPEKEFVGNTAPTLWHRIRPFIYMGGNVCRNMVHDESFHNDERNLVKHIII